MPAACRPTAPHTPKSGIVSLAGICWRAWCSPALVRDPLTWKLLIDMDSSCSKQSNNRGNNRAPFISASFCHTHQCPHPATTWSMECSQWWPPHAESHRSQGSPSAALFAMGEHPWAQLCATSLLFLNIFLCPVFQAFPLESLCCWWRRPGPFWVSMALEAHPALPLGDMGWLMTTETISSQVSLRGGSCSVQIVRDQLTVAKAQYGSNIVIRSRLLHRL